MGFLLGTLAVLGVIGMLLNSNHSSSDSHSSETDCVFTVTNPEGELYSINTADKNSPFYGPVWRSILKANDRGECFRGRAVKRSCGRADGAFHGYFIDIGGVQAFLPASKAAWFHSSEHDACGKSLALMLAEIHPNGPKAGSIVVDAYKPLKHVQTSQSREAFNPGAEPWVLAMDYDAASLIFPHFGSKTLRVPLNEAVSLAKRKGIKADKGSLTGRFWQLRVENWESGGVCKAHPVDIMPE